MPETPQERLAIKGRPKLTPSDFALTDRLFVGFDADDIERGRLKLAHVRYPDFSCNWSQFSLPGDVRYRVNGQPDDGCYSFSVKTARYDNMATPVHDPITDGGQENYAHVEVRELRDGEG